jgi:hypothetical protein
MSNDDRPSSDKSTKAAQQNKISHRDRKYPCWHPPYLKTCIIKNYRPKPYQDGSTYFTYCLSCLRDGGRVPKAMQHADKVKALVAAGVDRVKIQEQLGMSKASYYRCLKVA